MRLQLDQFGKIKSFVHMGQGGVLALIWVLTIVLFTRDGKTDGRVGWYFGLVGDLRFENQAMANQYDSAG